MMMGGRIYCLVVMCVVACLYVRLSVCQGISSPDLGTCPTGCPPPWVSLFQQFAPRIGPPSGPRPVCAVAISNRVIEPCRNSGNSCRSEPGLPTFTCCPSHCVSRVGDCFANSSPENICVPADIGPWRELFMQAFFSG